jgi:AraC family transcriptional regulator
VSRSEIPQLKPGSGYECTARSYRIDEFTLIDARLASGLRAPLHAHQHAYFGFAVDGDFADHYQYRGRTLEYASGTLAFDPSDAPHRTSSRGARILRIEVSPAFFDSVRSVRRVLNEPTVLTTPMLTSICRRLHHEITSGWAVGTSLVAQGLLMELVGLAARRSARRHQGLPPAWLRQTRDRLDAEFARAPGLNALAAGAGVHRVHLARAFRSFYGSSVGEYVRARQIDHAQRLLKETSEPIAMVALAAGFGDQSHFSTTFRKAVGVSPGRFRRLYRATPSARV